jgi:SDR family mycofactocin-dependent oxidoreductase
MGILESKVAFITGAARGQGRSHAVRLAEEGADIVAVDLCADIPTVPYSLGTAVELEETARQVDALGRRVVARSADVRDVDALTKVVHEGMAEFGRLDVVIANAGISPLRVVTEDPVKTWQDVIDVNLTGVFNTVQAALPAIIEGGQGGSIVLTSSTAGLKGNLSLKAVGGYAYAASKHGVVGLMRSFANDLAEHSIRVNTVLPTGVSTPMVFNEAMQEFLAEQPGAGAALCNLLPVEVIEPVDVSNAILWLVSDAARYVTGVALPVDAGFTAK